MAPLSVGDRVLVEPGREAATVCFVGAVAGTQGVWAGVQFDVEERGKHDGTHEGVRYFAAEGTSGAFVRLHKLITGVTVLQALQQKYELVSVGATCSACWCS